MNEREKVDEYIVAIKAMAETLAAFKQELIEQGFTRPEAVKLCGDWVANMFGNKQ